MTLTMSHKTDLSSPKSDPSRLLPLLLMDPAFRTKALLPMSSEMLSTAPWQASTESRTQRRK